MSHVRTPNQSKVLDTNPDNMLREKFPPKSLKWIPWNNNP